MYEERFYRKNMKPEGLVNFTVIEKESDLNISAKSLLKKEAKESILKYRNQINNYILTHKEFSKSLEPINVSENAPNIVKHMAKAAKAADVGPMASVAGAISEYVGKELLKYSSEIIIENGGDIFIKSDTTKKVSIYAGNSPFSNKIAISITPQQMPLGICTSAGTIGHSLSFGKADAVIVTSKDTLLADAAATSIGNLIKNPEDIDKGISFAKNIPNIEGLLIIIGDKLGVWGNIELCSV